MDNDINNNQRKETEPDYENGTEKTSMTSGNRILSSGGTMVSSEK